MSFIITESTIVKGLEVTITFDTEFTTIFDSIYDFMSYENIELNVDIRKDIREFVMVSTESEITGKNFTEVIHESDVISHMDKMLRALEEDEEYEICSLYLKLKNKYNLMINEK